MYIHANIVSKESEKEQVHLYDAAGADNALVFIEGQSWVYLCAHVSFDPHSQNIRAKIHRKTIHRERYHIIDFAPVTHA